MKRNKLLFAAMIFAGASSIALAQHGSHGGGGLGNGYDGPSIEDLRKRAMIQATEGQRSQLQNCSQVATRARSQAQTLKTPVPGSGPDFDRVRQQWTALRQEVEGMQTSHAAFVANLRAEQQTALKGRLQKIEQLRGDLTSLLAATDQDLAQNTPDSKRITGRVKDVEKLLKKWEKQHREIGSEIGA